MAVELATFVDNGTCSYLPDRQQEVGYRVLGQVSPEEWQRMLERGWRRFGQYVFRPRCAHCQECVSLRIPVAAFRPSKSQRRAARRCAGLRVEVGRPRVDDARMELLEAWHAERQATRGWAPSYDSPSLYEVSFCAPHPCAYELTIWRADELLAVDLVDLTPRALSSIYCYYDPRRPRLSLGTACVLREIDLARQLSLDHVYLGYRIADCRSSAYKSAFRPHELLWTRPGLDEAPQWLPGESVPAGRVD